jgi:hypothetical protein
MSLGFLTESTLTLRKSKELDVVGSNQALANLSSQISSRALSLEAQTRKRSRGARDRQRPDAGSSSSSSSRDAKDKRVRRDKYKGRVGDKETKPNVGVGARAALDKDPSQKEKEKLRMRALERKAKLYDQLRSNDNTHGGPIQDGHRRYLREGLVDFGEGRAESGWEHEDEGVIGTQSRNVEHSYNYGNGDGESRHSNEYSSRSRFDEPRDVAGSAVASASDAMGGCEGGGARGGGGGGGGGGGFVVRQRYEFGLTAREKAALPEVVADMARHGSDAQSQQSGQHSNGGADSAGSSARDDRRAKLLMKLQRS